MGKAAASSGKAKVPAKRASKAKAAAPAKKTPIKATSTSRKSVGVKRKAAGASAARNNKGTKKKDPPPVPKGWPVSSKLVSYPAPATKKDATTKNDNDIMDLDSDSDSDDNQPVIASGANFLKPGNLLQQQCNGADVFLRKRAVQSTSMVFPSGANVTNKGGPTRFLIMFPGRISLKVPTLSKADCSGTDGNNGEKSEEKEGGVEEKGEQAKKKNPFAPTHPPQLLGKLVSLGGEDRRMELRVSFPDASPPDQTSGGAEENASMSTSDDKPPKQLVMTGRAVPLSGKYMALTFKRTGGSKDSGSSGAGGKKKKGTGSIQCKDIFRSVIVLGDSKLMDGGGKSVPLKSVAKEEDCTDDNIENEDEKEATMKHYGGSERTLDGGGKHEDSGRKSLKAAPAASRQSFDSASSKDVDLESDNSDDKDDKDVDSSDAGSDGEFVVAVSKKRKSAGTAKKLKAKDDSDDGVEKVAPARKRAPRRSTANAANVSYMDENSDVDMDNGTSSGDDEGSDGDDDSDAEEVTRPRKKPNTKPVAKKVAAKAKKGSSKEDSPVINVESDEASSEGSEENKPKAKKPAAKKAATNAKTKPKGDSDDEVEEVASARKRTPRRSAAKSVNKSYIDESSDVDMDDGSKSDDGEESDAVEEAKPKAKSKAKKPAAKKATSKPVAKAKRGSTTISKTTDSVFNLNSDEDATNEKEDSEPIGMQSMKKAAAKGASAKPAAKGKGGLKTNTKAKKAVTKPAAKTKNGSKTSPKKTPVFAKKASDDIIEVDSGDDSKVSTPAKKPDEKKLQAISSDAKKRLSSISSSPSTSPLKSPISRGRRKKNSPKKTPTPNKENDLNLNDDTFSFL